jgi:photosystem I subunit 11
MSEFIKPYNNDPFVGHLATPITASAFTRNWLLNLPIYRKGISPLLRGLEIGMAHGYFLLGPFYKLGPLRNSEVALLSGLISTFGLLIILTAALTIYGIVSFDDECLDPLQTSQGWSNFTAGFFVGGAGGAGFIYLLIINAAFIL